MLLLRNNYYIELWGFAMCVDITYTTVKVLWKGHNKIAITILHFMQVSYILQWNNTVSTLNSCDKLRMYIMILRTNLKEIA